MPDALVVSQQQIGRRRLVAQHFERAQRNLDEISLVLLRENHLQFGDRNRQRREQRGDGLPLRFRVRSVRHSAQMIQGGAAAVGRLQRFQQPFHRCLVVPATLLLISPGAGNAGESV